MKRLIFAVAVILLPACAQAEPDIVRVLRELVWPPKVTSQEPVPVPISRPKPDLRLSAPPAPAAAENSRPYSRDVKAKVAEPSSRQAPLPKHAQKQKAKQKEVVRHSSRSQPAHETGNKTQPASADQERPARATCTPITVNCGLVCQHAWMGEAAAIALGKAWGYCEPTPAQRAAGKACIRRDCPQWLTK